MGGKTYTGKSRAGMYTLGSGRAMWGATWHELVTGHRIGRWPGMLCAAIDLDGGTLNAGARQLDPPIARATAGYGWPCR